MARIIKKLDLSTTAIVLTVAASNADGAPTQKEYWPVAGICGPISEVNGGALDPAAPESYPQAVVPTEQSWSESYEKSEVQLVCVPFSDGRTLLIDPRDVQDPAYESTTALIESIENACQITAP